MSIEPFYREKLRSVFNQRQRKNPAYSLRAYSQFLELSSAAVSEIIRGKRKLPQKHAKRIARKLELTPIEEKKFLSSLYCEKSSLKELDQFKVDLQDYQVLNEETHFKIIAEWEHYAVLSLMDLTSFLVTSKSVSERLNITELRAQEVLNHLQDAGLVSLSPKRHYLKSSHKMTTSIGQPSQAIRKANREAIEMALEKIETVPLEKRYFCSSTMAIDSNKIEEAKALMRDFKRKLAKLMEQNNKTDVYNFCMQFYPLTQMEKSNETIN